MIRSVVPAALRLRPGPSTPIALLLARRLGRDAERPGWAGRNRSRELRRIVGVRDAASEG